MIRHIYEVYSFGWAVNNLFILLDGWIFGRTLYTVQRITFKGDIVLAKDKNICKIYILRNLKIDDQLIISTKVSIGKQKVPCSNTAHKDHTAVTS